jgi:menaquinone-dependent protoporphyrinogen IX oxidase
MDSLVVYDAKFESSEKIAETVAGALRHYGPARLLGLNHLPPHDLEPFDLLFVGGPTQAHAGNAWMRQFVRALKARPAAGMVAATFDTRVRTPAVAANSAAKEIAGVLRRAGVRIFAPPESFFVKRGVPRLERGEAERAAAWAMAIADRLALSRWCAA